MSKWMIFTFMFLLLSSCRTFKEKSRIETDSLSSLRMIEEIRLTQQLRNSDYQFKDSGALQVVLIKADAPFRWQADSGLLGKAGNYQLYLIHKGQSVAKSGQYARRELEVKSEREQMDVHKSTKEVKKVSALPVGSKSSLLGLVILFGVVGLLFIRLRYGYPRAIGKGWHLM